MTLGELHKLSRALHTIAVTTGSLPDGAARPTEVMLFEDIARHPHTSVMEISRRTGLAQSRVSHLISDMIRHGSVICAPDPNDKRRKLLHVPPELLDRLSNAESDEAISTALHTLYPTLSDDAIEDVQTHLRALSTYLVQDQ